jgi:hypothetical protein
MLGLELSRLRRSSSLFSIVTYRTILPWIAHETQYWSFKYILGTVYSGKTEASEISPVWSGQPIVPSSPNHVRSM